MKQLDWKGGCRNDSHPQACRRMPDTLKGICDEFWEKAKGCLYFYLDAFKGFELLRDDLSTRQQLVIKARGNDQPKLSDQEYADSAEVPYIEASIDAENSLPPEFTVLLATTAGEHRKRNAEDGDNLQALGNTCLVILHSWWEEEYRGQFARCVSRDEMEIKSDIFGDICKLRNAIVHNNGIATDSVEKCKVLNWFKRGDRILFGFEKMQSLMSEVQKGLHTLYKELLIIGGLNGDQK